MPCSLNPYQDKVLFLYLYPSIKNKIICKAIYNPIILYQLCISSILSPPNNIFPYRSSLHRRFLAWCSPQCNRRH